MFEWSKFCRRAAVWGAAVILSVAAMPGWTEPTTATGDFSQTDWTFHILYSGNRATEIEPASQPTPLKLGGLAYEATIMNQAGGQSMPTLRLDTGNFARLQMTPDAWFRTNALLNYFTQYNFDAVNVTPIDLRYGIDELKAIADAGLVPLISANLYDTKTNERLFPAYRIVEVPQTGQAKPLKVGIIGISGDPNLAKNAPYSIPAKPRQIPDRSKDPVNKKLMEPEGEWQLNQRPVHEGALAIHQVADRRWVVAQAEPTKTPAGEKKSQPGLTQDVDEEEERRLQESLREGMTFFEYNMEKSMKLEAGPGAAQKLEQESERAKNPQPTPMAFGPIGVYHYPGAGATETTMRQGRPGQAETTFVPGSFRQVETQFSPSRQQPETGYAPVMRAIPNTLDRRQPTPFTPTPAPTATPRPASSSNADNADQRSQWQMVEIDGADVIFSRQTAKGGGGGPQSALGEAAAADSADSLSASEPRIFSPSQLKRELARVEVRDPLASVGSVIPELQEKEKCDLIIVMTYFPINNTRQLLTPLAKQVDLWLAGDWIDAKAHPEANELGWTLPVSALGQTLHQARIKVSPSGRIDLVSHEAHSISSQHIEADPVVRALVRDCNSRIAIHSRRINSANGDGLNSPTSGSETN